MATFHTVSEELRLGTDRQTFLRTLAVIREAEGGAAREELLVLLELPAKTENAEALAQSVFKALEELCFLDRTTDPYERFETALKEANAILAEASNRGLLRVNAVIGFLSGRDLHLTQAGEAEAYLIRKGQLTTVTEGLTTENAVDTFVNIASGRVENRDKVLLSSERLLRYATKSELTKIFSPHKEVGLALEELDEIIVLEGAQTTGVLAVDVLTEAVAAAAANRFELPAFASQGRAGELATHALGHARRGIAWLRDRLPEGVQLPRPAGQSPLNIDKNYLVLGALGVVILIILSISWSVGSRQNGLKLEEVKTVLAAVQANLDTAKIRRNIGDKTTATAELAKAEKSLQDLVATGLAAEEVGAKVKEVKVLRDELDNIHRFSALKPTVDFAKTAEKSPLVGLLNYHDRKMVFDAHKLFEATLNQIDNSAVLDAASTVRAGDYFTDRDALAFLTTDGKLLEWRDGAVASMHTTDETWKSAVDLATYGSNAYLLDPTNNQIWKYNREREQYGKAVAYSQNADLTKAVSLAIDGDVWALTRDGDGNMQNDILRLRRGEKKPLSIADLPADVWQNPTKIYTTENQKFLYVLDATGGRVLRFFKDPSDAGSDNRNLIYNTQYLFEDLKDIQDFWVDDSEQKIFVITKTALFEANMQ